VLATMRDGPGEEEEVRSCVSLHPWACADTCLVLYPPYGHPADPRELQKGEAPMLNASSGRCVQRGDPERAEG